MLFIIYIIYIFLLTPIRVHINYRLESRMTEAAVAELQFRKMLLLPCSLFKDQDFKIDT